MITKIKLIKQLEKQLLMEGVAPEIHSIILYHVNRVWDKVQSLTSKASEEA